MLYVLREITEIPKLQPFRYTVFCKRNNKMVIQNTIIGYKLRFTLLFVIII